MRLSVFILIAVSAYAQQWIDQGSGTVLKGSVFKAGLYGALVDCPHAGAPYCASPANNFQFASLEQYVLAAQSDCGVDKVHYHMYCTGGGHTDYYGNQVYDYDIAAKTITRLTDPSQLSSINFANYNTDGTGVTSHTGQSLVYMPNEDCMLDLGIGVGPAPGSHKFGFWICNLRTAPTWTPKASYKPITNPYLVVSGGTGCTANSLQIGSFTNGGGTGGTFSVWINSSGNPTGYGVVLANGSGYTAVPTTATVATCTGTVTMSGGQLAGSVVYDGGGDQGSNIVMDTTAVTESALIVQLSTFTMWRYTPSLDTGAGASPSPYAQLSTTGTTHIVIGATCAIATNVKKEFCVGASFNGGSGSGIYVIDISPGSTFAATNITASTTNCGALYTNTNPGFAYDDLTGKMVGYIGTGNNVTTFDPSASPNLTCTTTTISGGPTSSAYPAPSGSYTRGLSYFSNNLFITLPNASAHAFSLDLGTAPTITSSATLTAGTQNSAYTFTLTATGTAPITWSITSGTLPTGVSLNASTGVVSGTPTASGTFNFALKAANGFSPDATQNASLTINPVCLITSATLPAGKLGIPYSETVPTQGCASPAYSVSAGSLPTGLSLNSGSGLISGTPTVSGLSSFTISITDANGNPTQATSITIVPGPGVFSVSSGPGFVVR